MSLQHKHLHLPNAPPPNNPPPRSPPLPKPARHSESNYLHQMRTSHLPHLSPQPSRLNPTRILSQSNLPPPPILRLEVRTQTPWIGARQFTHPSTPILPSDLHSPQNLNSPSPRPRSTNLQPPQPTITTFAPVLHRPDANARL